ncbi:hypothetical protein [Agrobacterium cavarae]|uniref:hypothetical protein n=1 Tax=Agrobacterium cavarae TaxID=2528239 RepID=UPI002FDB79EC
MKHFSRMAGLFCLILAAHPALANHDCEVAPWDGDRRKSIPPNPSSSGLASIAGGETVTLWEGNNWEGKIFVVPMPKGDSKNVDMKAFSSSVKMWVTYPGKGQENLATTFGGDNRAMIVNMDAPSNGATVRAKFDSDTICFVCVLKQEHETAAEIAKRLEEWAKECGADRYCWRDKSIAHDVPHNSVVLPDIKNREASD